MKTTQELMNIVIDNGFYTANNEDERSSPFFCIAALKASNAGLLSKVEYQHIEYEIAKYLVNRSFLISCLRSLGLPSEYEDRLALYMDWDNKPSLDKLSVID